MVVLAVELSFESKPCRKSTGSAVVMPRKTPPPAAKGFSFGIVRELDRAERVWEDCGETSASVGRWGMEECDVEGDREGPWARELALERKKSVVGMSSRSVSETEVAEGLRGCKDGLLSC